MRSSNPDQDTEDEEIVDEILNSDQEESNENILMRKQNSRAKAGEAFNSESEKQLGQASSEQTSISQGPQDHHVFPHNHRNIKKLIPFKADDEDEMVVSAQKVELPARQDAEDIYNQGIAEQMSHGEREGVKQPRVPS